MDYNPKNSLANLALVLLLLLSGALYFCFFSPAKSNPLLPYRSSSSTNVRFPVDDLELALQKASMPNKTVIIAVVNKAYVDQSVNDDITMLDLFLESFWLGEDTTPLLDHLLLVAVDQTAYDRCMFKRLNCYRLVVTDGVDLGGEKVYMSRDFINLMWRRTLFLLDVLKRGYSFVFTDTDVMWLRNPFPKLNGNQTDDLQISVDSYNGNPRSENNLINTGFYHIRSNNRTISLFDTWYNMKDNSNGKKEQDVLLDLMSHGVFRTLGLQVRFLPTQYFSGFCQDSKDVWSVSTVHANCCRHISAKIKDLKAVHRDWKRFKAVIAKFPNLARHRPLNFRWSPHIGCMDSWKQPVIKDTNNTST